MTPTNKLRQNLSLLLCILLVACLSTVSVAVEPGYIVREFAEQLQNNDTSNFFANPAGYLGAAFENNPNLPIYIGVAAGIVILLLLLIITIVRKRKQARFWKERTHLEEELPATGSRRQKPDTQPQPSRAAADKDQTIDLFSERNIIPLEEQTPQPINEAGNKAEGGHSSNKKKEQTIHVEPLDFPTYTAKKASTIKTTTQKPDRQVLQELGVDHLPLFEAEPIIPSLKKQKTKQQSVGKSSKKPPAHKSMKAKPSTTGSPYDQDLSKYLQQPSGDVDDVSLHTRRNVDHKD